MRDAKADPNPHSFTFDEIWEQFSMAYNALTLCYEEPSESHEGRVRLLKQLNTYHELGILNDAGLATCMHHPSANTFEVYLDVYIMTEVVFAEIKKPIEIYTILDEMTLAFMGTEIHVYEDRQFISIDWKLCVVFVRQHNLLILLRWYETKKIITDADLLKRLQENGFSSAEKVRKFAEIAWKSIMNVETIPDTNKHERMQYELTWANTLRNSLVSCYRENIKEGSLPIHSDFEKWKPAGGEKFVDCYKKRTNNHLAETALQKNRIDLLIEYAQRGIIPSVTMLVTIIDHAGGDVNKIIEMIEKDQLLLKSREDETHHAGASSSTPPMVCCHHPVEIIELTQLNKKEQIMSQYRRLDLLVCLRFVSFKIRIFR